ncbi:MAG: hypothetical protein H0X42_06785 [Solirubrobacterales bacterium]|nr:hypothetical protein [Solirubrobacterales bacterium]
MSRIRIFMLFASLTVLATAFTACGGGGGSSDEDPQKVVENATLEGVESGTLALKVGVKSEGEQGGDLKFSLSGPFQAGAKGQLPEFDMKAKASGTIQGEPVNFDGALTLLSDRAFVGVKGTEYEVDPTTFGFVKSSLEQAQQQQGSTETGQATACQEAALGLEVSDFVEGLTNEGSAEVEGTDTTKVSGDLNTAGAVDALIELSKVPACATELESAGPLPLSELESAKGELTRSVKKAHVDLYVGSDNIIRKVATDLTIEPKGSSGEKVELEVELSLGAINEEPDISAPANAQPLEGLFQELGVNPLELAESLSSGAGLEGLLEGAIGGESSSGGGSTSPGESSLECFEHAQTPADLQKCSKLIS